jgi:hypothetical protein
VILCGDGMSIHLPLPVGEGGAFLGGSGAGMLKQLTGAINSL